MDDLEDYTVISYALGGIQERFEYSITPFKKLFLQTEQIRSPSRYKLVKSYDSQTNSVFLSK